MSSLDFKCHDHSKPTVKNDSVTRFFMKEKKLKCYSYLIAFRKFDSGDRLNGIKIFMFLIGEVLYRINSLG